MVGNSSNGCNRAVTPPLHNLVLHVRALCYNSPWSSILFFALRFTLACWRQPEALTWLTRFHRSVVLPILSGRILVIQYVLPLPPIVYMVGYQMCSPSVIKNNNKGAAGVDNKIEYIYIKHMQVSLAVYTSILKLKSLLSTNIWQMASNHLSVVDYLIYLENTD